MKVLAAAVTPVLTLTVIGSAYAQNIAPLCDVLEAYQALAAPVGAAYVPGVDVHGKPVVPADLNAVPGVPDKVSVPVTIDMVQRLNMPVPAGMKLDSGWGVIDIYKDGRVLYNDRDLTDPARSACGQPAAPAQTEPQVLNTEPKPVVEQVPKGRAGDDEIIWGEGY